MGFFGRKKKKEVVDEESQQSSADNISDLELAYENCIDEAGYHYDDGESDYSEGGESVPPPPPPPPPSPKHNLAHDTTETESHYTREEIEAPINKDPYFTADSSVDNKGSTKRRRRRNKILLIVAGCVPFCIVVGLAIWYGYLYATTNNKQQQQQQQSNTYASITDSKPNNTIVDNGATSTFDLLPSIPHEEEEIENKEDEVVQKIIIPEIMYNSVASTIDQRTHSQGNGLGRISGERSPIILNEEEEVGNEEDEEGVPKSMIPEEKEKLVANANNVLPPVVVVAQQEAEVDTPATTENNSVPPSNVSTKQTDTSSGNIGAATETQYIQITKQTDTSSNIGATAAMIDTTDTIHDGIVSPDNESDSDEMMQIVLSIDSSGYVTESTICALDQILASSHCENGIAVTSIFLCLGEETRVADQFWAWSEVPPAYAEVEKQDWGWVKDAPSRGREVMGLPDGRYILGLYANGRQSSEDDEVYPLLASFDFVVTCGGGN